MELEYNAYWATKEMKLNLDVAQVKRRIQIREVEKAYHKEEINKWYDSKPGF